PFFIAPTIPFSTAGRYWRGITPPTILSINSKPSPLPLDPEEPYHIAQAAKHLNLKHIVVTSVTRDDLADGGAEQFAQTIIEIKKLLPKSTVEVLVPDFEGSGDALQKVINVYPEVINHNIETVPRLYRLVRPKAVYENSLKLLKQIKIRDKDIISKSGIMIGLGEEEKEVVETMKDIISLRMFISGYYITDNIILHMTHMSLSGRIRKHF
ncbi:unnamed protein product, partial [marine sediment metagenome]